MPGIVISLVTGKLCIFMHLTTMLVCVCVCVWTVLDSCKSYTREDSILRCWMAWTTHIDRIQFNNVYGLFYSVEIVSNSATAVNSNHHPMNIIFTILFISTMGWTISCMTFNSSYNTHSSICSC
ncbi:hypothetical protein ACB092_01G134000 [Castanea dentata]